MTIRRSAPFVTTGLSGPPFRSPDGSENGCATLSSAVKRSPGPSRHAAGLSALSALVLATSITTLPVAGQTRPGQSRPEQTQVAIPGTQQVVTLALLPAGEFQMGSPVEEAGRHGDEGPMHAVALPSFWITTHEITHAQYAPFRFENFDGDAGPDGAGSFDVDAVTRPSPPYEDPSHGMGGDEHPTTGVTRWNALHYARWLSEKTGRLLRLPTEAEWEYACRSGSAEAFGAGVDNESAVAVHAWLESESGGMPHPVKGREPNAWGLYDIQGNAAEWVMDGYQADAYSRSDTALPAGSRGAVEAPFVGNATRGRGVVRGGAFDDPAHEARCAARYPEAAAWKRRDPQIPKSRWWNTDSPQVGFRLVAPAGEYTMDEIRAYWNALLSG